MPVIRFLPDKIMNVRPVETVFKEAIICKSEAPDDIFFCEVICSSCKRNHRNTGKLLLKISKYKIFRPEVMPPLTYTMGFINSKQRDPDVFKKVEKITFPHQPFRREVKQ